MEYDLIIPGLYLGNMSVDILKTLNIKQILSIGFDYPISNTIPYKYIAVNDEPSQVIYLFLSIPELLLLPFLKSNLISTSTVYSI